MSPAIWLLHASVQSYDASMSRRPCKTLDVAGLLEHALVREASSELQLIALEALLEVAGAQPVAFAQHYAPRLHWLRGLLSHTDSAGLTSVLLSSVN